MRPAFQQHSTARRSTPVARPPMRTALQDHSIARESTRTARPPMRPAFQQHSTARRSTPVARPPMRTALQDHSIAREDDRPALAASGAAAHPTRAGRSVIRTARRSSRVSQGGERRAETRTSPSPAAQCPAGGAFRRALRSPSARHLAFLVSTRAMLARAQPRRPCSWGTVWRRRCSTIRTGWRWSSRPPATPPSRGSRAGWVRGWMQPSWAENAH